MQEQYYRWYSHNMSRDVEMLVFGHAGMPLILFPTVQGEYYQNKNFGLIDAIGWFIETGKVRVYCPDSSDKQSFYNKGIHPRDKMLTHLAYERIIMQEVVPKAQRDGHCHKVAFAGASFGGYHAANLAFKYPGVTAHLFGMCAALDIAIPSFFHGYYDEDIYFNNPMDYVGGSYGHQLNLYRNMGIVLCCAEHDLCKEDNFRMHNLLNQKGVEHWFDFHEGRHHDWPLWRDVLPRYLGRVFNGY